MVGPPVAGVADQRLWAGLRYPVGVQVRLSSGLIGQVGSDMVRIRPHIPALVKGRRWSP